MLSDEHEKAQQYSVIARAMADEGNFQEAIANYAAAADLEVAALAVIPGEKVRTYSAIALSAVALMYKARRYRECEMLGYRLLAMDGVEEYARREVREIVDSSLDEARLAALGREYSRRAIDISLYGGEVGYGTAGIGAVLDHLTAQQALARRVTEWDLGLELRRSGLPPPLVDSLIDARVSQPIAGSYRFTIRFTEPMPALFPEILDEERVERIADRVFGLIRGATNGSLEAVAALNPPESYLPTLLRLVRNLAPDGRSVQCVEVRQTASAESIVQAPILLSSETRSRVSGLLRTIEPKPAPESVVLVGVLRALNLDGQLFSLTQKSGERVTVRGTRDLALDDVIGPMVNKRVRATVVPMRKSFRLLDVDYDESGEP